MKHKIISAFMAASMLISSTIAPLVQSKAFASEEIVENQSVLEQSSPEEKATSENSKPAAPTEIEVKEESPKNDEQLPEVLEEKSGTQDDESPTLVNEEIEAEKPEKILEKSSFAKIYTNQSYTSLSNENISLKITGPMPEHGEVKAYEIPNPITDIEKENILGVGFEIFDKDGNPYNKANSDEYKIEIKSNEVSNLKEVFLYEKRENEIRFAEKRDFTKLADLIKFESRADQFVLAKEIVNQEEDKAPDEYIEKSVLEKEDISKSVDQESKNEEITEPTDILDSFIKSSEIKDEEKVNKEESQKNLSQELVDWRKDLVEALADKKENEEIPTEEIKNKEEKLEDPVEEKETEEVTSKNSKPVEADKEDDSKTNEQEISEKSDQEQEEKLTYQQVLAKIYTDSSYSQYSSDSTRIKLSGKLPGFTKIKAYPVEIKIEGQEVLAAYDITIFDENNNEYKVTSKNDINVQITNQKIRKASEVEVYHKEDERAPEEKVEVANKSRDTVSFKADSFSIYAITDPKAQATRTYKFYVRNTDGSLKLINTQTIRSGEMLQKPPVPILNDRGRYAGWFPIGESKQEHGDNEVHFFTPITFDTKTPVTIEAEPLFLDNAYIDFKERVYITDKNKDKFSIPAGYTLAADGYYKDANGNKLYRDEVFKTRVQDFGIPIGEAHIPVIKDEATDPNKPGPVLSYWSINPEGGEIFDFKNTPITRDLIKKQEAISGESQVVRLDLFAIYEDGYTVSFDSQGGSHVTRQIVKKGKTLDTNKIIDPIKPGYVFKGWSLTPGGNIINIENRVISKSETLYAVYDKLPGTYTVSHYTENINDTGFTFYKSETVVEQVGNYTKDGEYFRNPANSEIAKDLVSKGYTIPKSVTPSDKPALVKADGSTNIKVYYRRPRYNLNVYSTWLLQGVPSKEFTVQYKEGEDTKDSWDRMGQKLGRYVVREGSLDGPVMKVPPKMPARELNLYFLPTIGNEEWYTFYIEVDENDKPILDSSGNTKVIRKTTHNAIIAGLEKYVGGDTVEGFEYRYVTQPGQHEDSPKVYTRGQPKEVRTFYKRLSYQLIFKTNNINYTDRIKTVPYETKIAPLVPTDIKIGDTDKNGATFKGWYDNQQLTGLPVEFTNLTMPAKDTTYFGKWEQQKHNIRVYREMTTPGQVSSPDKIINFQVNRGSMLKRDDAAWNPIKPAKLKDDPNTKLTWYRFSGTQFEEYKFDEPITEDLFLYPVWQYFDPVTKSYRPLEDIHIITYTDGTNSFTDKNLYLNNAAAILQAPYVLGNVDKLEDPENLNNTYFGNLKVPAGKHFQGWLLNNDPSRIYRPGEVINVTSDMTFYAKWGEYDKTSINLYEQKPGTDKSKFTTQKMRENGTIKLPTPSASNYIFQGWSKSPTGSVDFKAGQEVMVTNENLPNSLYGIWKANRTITIHENQPTGTQNNYKKENVADGSFTFPAPAKVSGYYFKGWSTSSNNNVLYKPGQTINVSEANPLPTDIYGVWEEAEKLTLTAKFNTTDANKTTLKYTITITEPSASVADNSLFKMFISTSYAADTSNQRVETVSLANNQSTTIGDITPGSTISITQETIPFTTTSYSINGSNVVVGNTATTTATNEDINVVFYNVEQSLTFKSNYPVTSLNSTGNSLTNKEITFSQSSQLSRTFYNSTGTTNLDTRIYLQNNNNIPVPYGYRFLYYESQDIDPGYKFPGSAPGSTLLQHGSTYVAKWSEPSTINLRIINPDDVDISEYDYLNVFYYTINSSNKKGPGTGKLYKNPYKGQVSWEVPTFYDFDSLDLQNSSGLSDEIFLQPGAIIQKDGYTMTLEVDPKTANNEFNNNDGFTQNIRLIIAKDVPPPTGLIDNFAPMALMLALASMAFVYRLYKRNKLAGGIDEWIRKSWRFFKQS